MESGENHGQGHAPVGDLLNEQTQQLAAALADRLNPAPTPKNEGASEDVASAGRMDGELEADRDHSPETTVGEDRNEIPATEAGNLEPSEKHAPIANVSHAEAADTTDGGDDEAAYTGKFSIAPMPRRVHRAAVAADRVAASPAAQVAQAWCQSRRAVDHCGRRDVVLGDRGPLRPDDALYVKNGRAVLEAIDTVHGPDTDVEVRCILFAGTEADAVQEMCVQALGTLDASALEKARALRSLKIVQRIGNVDIAERYPRLTPTKISHMINAARLETEHPSLFLTLEEQRAHEVPVEGCQLIGRPIEDTGAATGTTTSAAARRDAALALARLLARELARIHHKASSSGEPEAER